MLTGIHFLLTYSCTNECDHCFLYCSPASRGTFTRAQLGRAFDEIERIGTIETVYFEGGEAFLYYPLLLEGLRMAARRGLRSGIVTNAYWATSLEDAEMWLEPIRQIGIADLSISDDAFHRSEEEGSPPKLALAAARKLGMPCDSICIQPGKVLFKGRAAAKLTQGLPRRRCEELTSCPHEDLEAPSRVHLDCFGNVHVCQGLSMGNMWETPLEELVRDYDPRRHPVIGPLVAGGPAALAREHGLKTPDEFVDECHYCYDVRRTLLGRLSGCLGPRQVYGLE